MPLILFKNLIKELIIM